MTIANLFAHIGLKTDEHKAKSFSSAMQGVKGALFAVTGAAAAASAVIAKVTSDAFASATGFRQFELETGVSAQALQKWQSVAEQTGSSAEDVANSIKAITDNLAKISLGEGNIGGFQLLGIDTNQEPIKILEQLREKTAGVSEAQRKNALSMIGVTAGMIPILDMTAERFEQMAGHGFIISDGALKSLNATKGALSLAGRAVKWLKAQIAVALAPQMKKMSQQFTEFIRLNKEGFIDGFKKALTFISRFVTMISRGAQALNQMVTSTIGWKNAIIGVVAVITAMKGFALLTSPIGMLVAGFLALFLILEDIYVYSKGGKSLFGEFEKSFPKIAAVMKGAFDKMVEAFNLIKYIIKGDDLGIQRILDQWGLLGKAIQFVLDLFKKETWEKATEKLQQFGKMFQYQTVGLPLPVV